jgi:alpha-ribazole phosphatase
MATRLYLIRHGESVSAYDGRYYGQTDLALSEKGKEQMALLGERLIHTPPRKIYCSDLARSRESAEVLAGKMGLHPVICPQLREVDMGLWEGLSYEEINLLHPEEAARWASGSLTFRFPQGEGLRSLKARVLLTCQKLVKQNPDTTFAIVGHAGPNRIILCQALGISLRNLWRLGQDYGGLSVIEYHGDYSRVSLLNFREEFSGELD